MNHSNFENESLEGKTFFFWWNISFHLQVVNRFSKGTWDFDGKIFPHLTYYPDYLIYLLSLFFGFFSIQIFSVDLSNKNENNSFMREYKTYVKCWGKLRDMKKIIADRIMKLSNYINKILCQIKCGNIISQ